MTRRLIVPVRHPSSSRALRTLTLLVATASVSACGGGGDEEVVATTQPVVVTAAPTTIALPTTTVPPTTLAPTPASYVTDGASVIVANASGINGAAGRLSDRLAIVGFSTVTATNSADSVSGLQTTQIYFDPAVPAAKAVADSLRLALGGGSIEVIELVLPALTESGDLGVASVLVLMGNDVADKSLEELQGATPAASSADAGSTDSAPPSSDSTGG